MEGRDMDIIRNNMSSAQMAGRILRDVIRDDEAQILGFVRHRGLQCVVEWMSGKSEEDIELHFTGLEVLSDIIHMFVSSQTTPIDRFAHLAQHPADMFLCVQGSHY